MRPIVILLCLVLLAHAARAQQATRPDSVNLQKAIENVNIVPGSSRQSLRHYKSTKIQIRRFDEAIWKKVAGATDFSEVAKEQKKSAPVRIRPEVSGPLKYVIWILIIGCVCWLLYIIIRNTTWEQKINKREFQIDDITKPVEDINSLDLKDLLRKALAAGDYRLAIRVYYLEVLYQLNTTGKIIWKKDKTNRDYLGELFTNGYFFEETRRLTSIYEQVWYGEHTITATSFGHIKVVFEKLQQQLRTA